MLDISNVEQNWGFSLHHRQSPFSKPTIWNAPEALPWFTLSRAKEGEKKSKQIRVGNIYGGKKNETVFCRKRKHSPSLFTNRICAPSKLWQPPLILIITVFFLFFFRSNFPVATHLKTWFDIEITNFNVPCNCKMSLLFYFRLLFFFLLPIFPFLSCKKCICIYVCVHRECSPIGFPQFNSRA